jgi:hypothetical protein
MQCKDKAVRRVAIMWRLNKLGMRKKCKQCGKEFTQSHVMECLKLGERQEDRDRHPQLVAKWEEERRKLDSAIGYTFIDPLINGQKWDELKDAWLEVKEILVEGASECPPPDGSEGAQEGGDVVLLLQAW